MILFPLPDQYMGAEKNFEWNSYTEITGHPTGEGEIYYWVMRFDVRSLWLEAPLPAVETGLLGG